MDFIYHTHTHINMQVNFIKNLVVCTMCYDKIHKALKSYIHLGHFEDCVRVKLKLMFENFVRAIRKYRTNYNYINVLEIMGWMSYVTILGIG